MRYLHTMLRVRNLDQALDFYCNKLGLKEARRRVDEKNRYTLVFLAAPEDETLVRRGALFRSSRLRGRRHLWAMRKIDEGRRHHQPAAARRRDGFRALARQALDRALTERRPAAAEGAVGFHAQHRQVVRRPLLSHMGAKL